MPKAAAAVIRDQSPPLMMLGIIYALLFNAGLLAVSPLFTSGSFPVPSSTAAQIVAFFRANGGPLTITSALQFGSAIPLGLYTATVVNRLQFLGVRAAGVNIALFGGYTTAALMLLATSVMWATASVASDVLCHAMYLTSLNPSLPNSSSVIYCGARQMLGMRASRILVVSGGGSAAAECGRTERSPRPPRVTAPPRNARLGIMLSARA